MPTIPPEENNEYFIDAESGAEMARLTNQAGLLTRHLGGLLPPGVDVNTPDDILDIACGPGEWVNDVAFAYPEIEVTGIDISKTMIQYAATMARVQGLNNAHFQTMDATQPLNFPDNSFGFVNARLIVGFMAATAWPNFLRECLRITRPNGYICLAECEIGMCGITNSPATERLNEMGVRALKQAGRSFSPDGRTIGTTAVMARLLRDAGYQHIQKQPYAVDFSAGTEDHEAFFQDFRIGFELLKPFLIKNRVTTKEEVDEVYQHMLIEMLSDDFCALWYFLKAWGQKPA